MLITSLIVIMVGALLALALPAYRWLGLIVAVVGVVLLMVAVVDVDAEGAMLAAASWR